MLFISIPKPCHEKWNEMTPNEQGAFCKVCSKSVVDFTSLSDDEVKTYFFQNREKSTCGRFRNDQLTNSDNILPRLLAEPLPFWKKFLGIVIILFSGLLTGCHDKTTGKPLLANPIIGVSEVEPVLDSSVTCNITMEGNVESLVVGEVIEDVYAIPAGDKIVAPFRLEDCTVGMERIMDSPDSISKPTLDEDGREKKMNDNPDDNY